MDLWPIAENLGVYPAEKDAPNGDIIIFINKTNIGVSRKTNTSLKRRLEKLWSYVFNKMT